MNEMDYTNRELDRMFNEIKDLLIDIKEQTTRTNGRVSKLELWREGMVGKFIGASAVAGFVWAIAWSFISKQF